MNEIELARGDRVTFRHPLTWAIVRGTVDSFERSDHVSPQSDCFVVVDDGKTTPMHRINTKFLDLVNFKVEG